MKIPKSNVIVDSDTDLEIDVANLEKEFRNFPSIRFAYSEMSENAVFDVETKKQQLKELRAKKYIDHKTASASGGTKLTEAHIEALLDTDEDIKEATRLYLEAKRDSGLISEFTKSIDAKKDCLISLAADARKE